MEKGQRGGAVQEGNLVMDNTRRCPCVGCHSRVEREWGRRAVGGSVGSPVGHRPPWGCPVWCHHGIEQDKNSR